MYNLVKVLGHIVTYFVCAITIDKINLSDSFILNYFIISPMISELLWFLSYCTCNNLIYQKFDIDIVVPSVVGSIGYTISYVAYAFIIFGILISLKKIGVLPFVSNFDTKVLNWIVVYCINKIEGFSNKIVQALLV